MLCPSRSPLLLSSAKPSSLICPRRICQSFVASESDNDFEIVATLPRIVVPHKRYKLADFKSPFMTTREPIDTFITPPPAEYLHPFKSRVLNKIRFLIIVGMYQ